MYNPLYILYLFTLMFFFLPKQDLNAQSNPNLDTALVKIYGADDYGMKMFTFVLLTSGDSTYSDKDFVQKCFKGHLINIQALVKEGKLIVAGPFGKNDKQYRGLFIFNSSETTEVKSFLDRDPAIENHILKAEIIPWYGSAALSAYLEIADKIWKVKP